VIITRAAANTLMEFSNRQNEQLIFHLGKISSLSNNQTSFRWSDFFVAKSSYAIITDARQGESNAI
jgi:hypothetical protein